MSTPRIAQLTDELVSCCQFRPLEKSAAGGLTPPEETKYVRFPPKLIAFAKLLPGNDHCPDCKLRLAPVVSNSLTWANIGFGTLICEECAFKHIHVLKNTSVVALNSSSWKLHQILSVLEGGNREMLKSLGRIRRISLTGAKELNTFEFRYNSKEAATYQRRLSKKSLDACRTFKGIGVRKQQQQKTFELPEAMKTDQLSQNMVTMVRPSQDPRPISKADLHDRSNREEKSNLEQQQQPSTSKLRQIFSVQNESKGNASQRLLQMMKKKIPVGTMPNDRKSQPQSKKNISGRSRIQPDKVSLVDDDSVSVFFERINSLEREEMQMKLEKQHPDQRTNSSSYQNKILRPPPTDKFHSRLENRSNDAVFDRFQMQRNHERSKEALKWRDSHKQRMNGAGLSTANIQERDFNGHINEKKVSTRQQRVFNTLPNPGQKGTAPFVDPNDNRHHFPKHGRQTPAQNSMNNERPSIQKYISTRIVGNSVGGTRPSRTTVVESVGNMPTVDIGDERLSGTKQSTSSSTQGRNSNILRQERYSSTRDTKGDDASGKHGREENHQSVPALDFPPSRHINEERKHGVGQNRPSFPQSKRSGIYREGEIDQGRKGNERENERVAVVKDLYEEPRPTLTIPPFDPTRQVNEETKRRREEASKRRIMDSHRGPAMPQKGNNLDGDNKRQDSLLGNFTRRQTDPDLMTFPEKQNSDTTEKWMSNISSDSRSKQPSHHGAVNQPNTHLSSRKFTNNSSTSSGNVDAVENSDEAISKPSQNQSDRSRPTKRPSSFENEYLGNVETVAMTNLSKSRRRPSMETGIQTIDSEDAVARRQTDDGYKSYESQKIDDGNKSYESPLAPKIVLELPADMEAKFHHTRIHKRVSMDTCTAIVTEEPAFVDVPGEPIFPPYTDNFAPITRPRHTRLSSADTIPISNRSDSKGSKSSSKDSSQSDSRSRSRNRNVDQYMSYLEQQSTSTNKARVVNVTKRRSQLRTQVHGKKVAPSNTNTEFQSGPFYMQP